MKCSVALVISASQLGVYTGPGLRASMLIILELVGSMHDQQLMFGVTSILSHIL